MSTETAEPGTRDRLVAAMIEALGTRGYHGVGLSELLGMARAPKGVLYHHFPGGKGELAVHAITTVAQRLCADLDRLFQRNADPLVAMASWMGSAQRSLEKSGFERGCPLATIGLESTAADAAIRDAVTQGFTAIRTRLSGVLVQAGMAESTARNMAALMVSAYEGALLQARVAGSAQTMRDTLEALLGLLRLSLPLSEPPRPSQPASRNPETRT